MERKIVKGNCCKNCDHQRQRVFRKHNELALFVSKNRAECRNLPYNILKDEGFVKVFWCRIEEPIRIGTQTLKKRTDQKGICPSFENELEE